MSKKVLSKLFLCWATFTAILGHVWPVGREMNTLESLEEKRPHRCSLGLCLPFIMAYSPLTVFSFLFGIFILTPFWDVPYRLPEKGNIPVPYLLSIFQFFISNATKII